jgi:hypothetical protein
MHRSLRRFFGRSATSRALPRRRSARLELEHLDGRIVPSTTGNMSQVLDAHGNSVAYYIDGQHNLWESYTGGQAFEIDGSGKDNAVSAGLDRNGYAVPYVHNFDNSLWEFRNDGSGWGWHFVQVGVTSFAAGDTPDTVWYISDGCLNVQYPQRGGSSQLDAGPWGPGGASVQVSPGKSASGAVVVYLLKADGDVWKYDPQTWGEYQLSSEMGFTQNGTELDAT